MPRQNFEAMQDQQTKTAYFIYDSRYWREPFKATLFTTCDTIEEAREEAPEYGDNNVIVEVVYHKNDAGKFDAYTEKIVQ